MLSGLLALLSFLLAVGLLVAVHEWGHYRMATACGVQVLRFSVGFGPALLRWRRRVHGAMQETEFVVAAVPLGGYVRMLDGREGEIPVGQETYAFDRQTVWVRSLIVLAGPLANAVLAVLLYALAAWWGQQVVLPVLATPEPHSLISKSGLRSGDWVRSVANAGAPPETVDSYAELLSVLQEAMQDRRDVVLSVVQMNLAKSKRSPESLAELDVDHLPSREVWLRWTSFVPLQSAKDDAARWRLVGFRGPWSPPVIAGVQPDSPAERAGLQNDDRITTINGVMVHDAVHLQDLIRKAASRADAQRGDSGDRDAAETNEIEAMQWHVERAGRVVTLSVRPERVQTEEGFVGRVGVQLSQSSPSAWVQQDFAKGLQSALNKTWFVVSQTLSSLAQIFQGSPVSAHLAGPVSIAHYAGQAATHGVTTFLSFLAVLSISLAVLNLLPLPMLDGGHLLQLMLEAVRGKALSTVNQIRLQQLGLTLLVLLMGVALWGDWQRLTG